MSAETTNNKAETKLNAETWKQFHRSDWNMVKTPAQKKFVKDTMRAAYHTGTDSNILMPASIVDYWMSVLSVKTFLDAMAKQLANKYIELFALAKLDVGTADKEKFFRKNFKSGSITLAHVMKVLKVPESS